MKSRFFWILGLSFSLWGSIYPVKAEPVKSAKDLEKKIEQAADRLRYLQLRLQESDDQEKWNDQLVKDIFASPSSSFFAEITKDLVESLVQKTSQGVLFTYAQRFPVGDLRFGLGPSWKDPEGLMWFDSLDQTTSRYEEAILKCAQLGARLPTVDEYRRLILALGDGRFLPQLFQSPSYRIPDFLSDLRQSIFWVERLSEGVARNNDLAFFGSVGVIITFPKGDHWKIRCVY